MSSDDLMAWLGPAADQLTPEQLDQVAAEARDIDARYPDPDESHLREAALSAVVQYVLGDTTPEDAARELIAARTAQARAYAAALQVAVVAHRVDGVPKAIAARRAGINRMSLLKALGERD